MNVKAVYYGIISVFSVAAGAMVQMLGGWDSALQLLCVVMASDYMTGIICALVWKKSPKSDDGSFNSKASLKGLLRKAGILLAVLIAYQLDNMAGTKFVRTSVIMFFTANDGFSVIENLGIMGLPMPKTMKNAFELLRQRGESGNEDSTASG